MTSERLAFFIILAWVLVVVYRIGDPPASYQRPRDPPTYVHDECYQAFTAGRYVRGDHAAWDPSATRVSAAEFATDDMTRFTAYEVVHPPTAKMIMAGWIAALGFQPLAFRLGSAIFGILTLAMSGSLARAMRGPAFAVIVVLLLACDGMVFVMSRVAMNDIYVTGCLMTAVYLLFRSWTARVHALRWQIAAGAAFGVALSTKWNAAPVLLVAAIVDAARIAVQARQRSLVGAPLRRHVATWAFAFVAAPICLYLASYVPYFVIGHGWRDFVGLQRSMWTYHGTLTATHAESSRWWQWPWVTRPVWFFLHRSSDGERVIYAMGNPLLWWAFVPSLAWVAARLWRQRQLADAVIVLGFCAVWLPWAFVRRVTFMQYLLPAVRFGALAVATVLDDVARAARRAGRALCVGYVAACLALFVNFYPFWSARLVTRAQLDGQRWFWFDAWRPPTSARP